jgi:hypothetical protein
MFNIFQLVKMYLKTQMIQAVNLKKEKVVCHLHLDFNTRTSLNLAQVEEVYLHNPQHLIKVRESVLHMKIELS